MHIISGACDFREILPHQTKTLNRVMGIQKSDHNADIQGDQFET